LDILFQEDSYKVEEDEIKPKRPRKKTKPSALTRPPKKGKKKKNQRKSAALQMAMEEATVMSGKNFNSPDHKGLCQLFPSLDVQCHLLL